MGTDAFRVDMAASLIKGDTDGTAMQKFWHEIREHIQRRNPDVLLVAEWGYPSDAINSGFHLDFLLHSGPSAYRSLFRYEKGRNTTSELVGHSYFNAEGKGYIGHITGNHDMQRLAYKRTTQEVKVCMAFLFTMPGYPFVYERMANGKKLFIALNPSGYRHYYDAPKLGKILLSHNKEQSGDPIIMNGISFVIAEE